jgi:N-acetylglutamate synthase-like GNAT family acetyltransferase
MEIIYLSERPDLISTLASWAFNEWHQYDPSFTKQKALDSFAAKLNCNKIPLTIVALEDNSPIGMISLKANIPVSGHEDKLPWIGSLYVIPGKRGLGVGKTLLSTINNIAYELGYYKLFLFTSVSNAASWYSNMGWQQVESSFYQNHPITRMEYEINKKDKLLAKKDHIQPKLFG